MAGGITEAKRVGLQNQLILALHAHRCIKRAEFVKNMVATSGIVEPVDIDNKCRVVNCKKMQELLVHLRQCSNCRSCDYRGCVSVRMTIQHWRACKDGNCPVCKDVRLLQPPTRKENAGTVDKAWTKNFSDATRRVITEKFVAELLEKLCSLGNRSADEISAARKRYIDVEQSVFDSSSSLDQYLYALGGELHRLKNE